MKTNHSLLVKYKLDLYDDNEELACKYRELVKAHYKYLKETPMQVFEDGRIQIPNKGVIEWEMDRFYEEVEEKDEA